MGKSKRDIENFGDREIFTFKESIKKLRIAHVGASRNANNPEMHLFADADRWHFQVVSHWLRDNDPAMSMRLNNRDDIFLDLNDGKDFLKDKEKYDIVILHMVYSAPEEIKNYYVNKMNTIYNQSDLHDRENWKNRLFDTGAEYIFAFGDLDEVSGEYLGKLPGYKGPIKGNSGLSIYVKPISSKT